MNERSRVVIEKMADVVLRRTGLLGLLRQVETDARSVLRVLAYHRVGDVALDPTGGDPSLISASPDGFSQQIRLLARHYDPIGIGDLVGSLNGSTPLPRRAVLVTFDDGYRDFLTTAWPILKEHHVPVVLFVPTAYPDRNRRFWWDELWQMVWQSPGSAVSCSWVGRLDVRTPSERRSAIAQLRRMMRSLHLNVIEQRMAELRALLGEVRETSPPVLGWDELRGLGREGVMIASHGHTHASLPALGEEEIVREIDQSRLDLQRELGSTPRLFAYPFGHHDRRVAGVLARSGFVAAFSAVSGRNVISRVDRFAMFRQAVNSRHSLSRIQLGLSGFYRPSPERAQAAARSVR